jgi:hypothetical protein
MISPHFPPDTSAASHRVRLLAPHLEANGWIPTVLTIWPDAYEGRLDPDLEALVPQSLVVERARAISPAETRRFGVGDLGIRALPGIYSKAVELMRRDRYSALFITVYPTYPALLGGRLKRQFTVPFVLDYQDPWVGAWGVSVGGGTNGTPDVRSRMSRRVATMLEPRAVRAADAITAVSRKTFDEVCERNPAVSGLPFRELPLGGEPADFDFLREHPRLNPWFDRTDGYFHLCYTGTILPLGIETLRAFLESVAAIRDSSPEEYNRLRIHFFGTSNQTVGNLDTRVMQHAAELGVADVVTERPGRIDYLDSLNVQVEASAVLLLGSSEQHYTASKIYPALLSERPILAVYHKASTVSAILNASGRADVHTVTYDDVRRAGDVVPEMSKALVATMHDHSSAHGGSSLLEKYSAAGLAKSLAQLLDQVA